jgi:hypothetical protein
MRPEIPNILTRVISAAEKTLAKPTGDDRRRDALEQLFEEVDQARQWPTDEPRRFVNEWTRDLVRHLRTLERLGPLGRHTDPDEYSRANKIAAALLPFVAVDKLAARQVELQAGRGDRR